MSAAVDAGAALLARAQAAVHASPDRARDLLIEASELLATAGDDARLAQACELMAWIAIDTGELALAEEPLAAAAAAYQTQASGLAVDLALARIEAMRAFLAEPEPLTDDAEVVAAEAELAAALFQNAGYLVTEPAVQRQAVAWRTRLDLQRRVPMRNGAWPSLRRIELAFELDPLDTALLAAAAVPALDRTAAAALEAAQGCVGLSEPALLFASVAPAVTRRTGIGAWSALARLRSRALLRPDPAVLVEPDVLAYLCGARPLAAALAGRMRRREPASLVVAPDLPPLPPDLREHVQHGRGHIGLPGAGWAIDAALAALASETGLALVHVQLADLADHGDAGALAHVIAAAIREARLTAATALLDWGNGPDPARTAIMAEIRALLARTPWMLYLVSQRPEALAQLLGPGDLALQLSEEQSMAARDPAQQAARQAAQNAAQDADRVLNRARDLALGNQLAQAAPLYEQGGQLLFQANKPAEAVTVLAAAARLRAMLGELDAAAAQLDRVEDQARAVGKLGEVARVRAELVDQAGDPAARRQAWQAAFDSGDRGQRFFALLRLADVAREQEEPAMVAALLEQALAFAPPDDAAQAADIHIERAVSLCMLERHQDAEQALQAADALSGDDPILRARSTGQRGVIALAQGNPTSALAHGEQARTLAVSAQDIPTYLSASMLIYMAHRQLGDLMRAYDTLVRARVSLHNLQGPEGAQLIQPALDVFAEQLGEDAFAAVHEQWAAWRRSQIQV